MPSVSVFQCVCDSGQLVYIYHQKRSNILLSTPAAARVCLLSLSPSLSLFHTFWINRLWFTYHELMSPPISVFLSLFFFLLSIFLPFPQSLIPVSLSRSFINPPPFILHHNLSLPTVSPLTPSLNLSLSPLSLLISPCPIPLLFLSLSLSGVNVGVIEECWMCAVTGLISCSDAWSARSSL